MLIVSLKVHACFSEAKNPLAHKSVGWLGSNPPSANIHAVAKPASRCIPAVDVCVGLKFNSTHIFFLTLFFCNSRNS